MNRKHLLSVTDLTSTEAQELFNLAEQIKNEPRSFDHALDGITVALINEKQSLRTRVTFEIGTHSMGGYCVVLSGQDFIMGQRESVPDIARNLERWVQLTVARVYRQQTLEELAHWGSVPVVNALSDSEHPCQALADFLTLHERGLRTTDVKLAFIGDGNNVCHSLLLLGALLGSDVRVAAPEGYAPDPAIVDRAQALAQQSGARLSIGQDPVEAVRGANALYTDTWISMGQEAESENRRKVFGRYQINSELLQHADRDAVVMHCLPAHRGEEITDEIMDGPQSVVFDEAENRLHIQKAVMLTLLGRQP